MDELTIKAAELLDKMKPFAPSAAPGQNFLPPDRRCDVEGHGVSTPLWRAGDGPATLFVHGWDDSHRVWRQFAMHNLQFGKPVLLMDLPAHGASKAERCTWLNAGQAVADVCAAEAPVTTAIAHSFGCLAVVRAIELGAAIDSIVLIAPALGTAENSWHARQSKAGAPSDVIARSEELFREATGHDIDGPDFQSVLASFPGRILLIGSEADESCPSEPIRDLAATLKNATLVEDFELGHRELVLAPRILSQINEFLESW